MKKIFQNITPILMLIFIVILIWPDSEQAMATKQKETAFERVMRTKTLRCGYVQWPPMLSKDPNTGKITGAFPELVETAAKYLGLKVKWVQETDWGIYPEDLKRGKFDAICAGAWQTIQAAPHILFTKPALYNPLYVYVRTNETRFNNITDANNKNIKAIMTTGAHADKLVDDYLNNAQIITVPPLTHASEIFLSIADNKADLTFGNAPDAELFMQNNPGKIKRLTNEPFQSFGSPLIGVKMGEYNLVNMFNSTLNVMLLDGTVDKVLDKYAPNKKVYLRVKKPYEVK